jgi:Serotonin (5-HT) neurotransmitter transporter, N-terminus
MAGQQQCGRAENEVCSQDEYEKGKVHNGYSAAVSCGEECTALE